MKELDSVKLKKDFKGIQKDTKGAIVHKYNNRDFEVEFIDEDGNTIDVVTVSSEYLELLESYKET